MLPKTRPGTVHFVDSISLNPLKTTARWCGCYLIYRAIKCLPRVTKDSSPHLTSNIVILVRMANT